MNVARRLLSVAAVLLVLLAAGGCFGGRGSEEGGEAAPAPGKEVAAPAPGEEIAGGGSGDATPSRAAAPAPEQGGGEGAQPPAPSGIPEIPPASTGDRIIKEGTIALEIEKGGYAAAFSRVMAAATRLGGTVVATTSTNSGDGGTSGSVTIRVPVGNYEQLLVAVGEIGTVRSQQVSSQDVTVEYVDLQSRLTHLQAQERFYLSLLDRAQGVADAIAIQQQLEGLQSQLEQVKGRIRYLDERTAFSTLTVELLEPGAALPAKPDAGARPSLARYWASARDAFVHVVGGMIVVAFFLAPLVVPLALLAAGWWMLRRRQPAAVEPE